MNYYKQKFVVTVLSDTPMEWDNLRDIAYEIDEGGSVGMIDELAMTELTPEEAARELVVMGSEPDFFGLPDAVFAPTPEPVEVGTMIEQIVAEMDSWGADDVLDWAKDARRGILKSVSPEIVRAEWYDAMPDEEEKP